MKTILFVFPFIFFLYSFVFGQGISSQTIGAQTSVANSKTLTTATDSLQNICAGQPSTYFKYWYTLTITTDADIQMSSSSVFEQYKTFTLKANESYTSIHRDAVLFDDYYFRAVSTNANIRIILEGR
ncbi:MAG TPA: hypothetical protein PLS49_03980 [Candidatus Woesebacteria bacterium]|nr:hypothetical protein [Candidatus Woesebacteria bacterium]